MFWCFLLGFCNIRVLQHVEFAKTVESHLHAAILKYAINVDYNDDVFSSFLALDGSPVVTEQFPLDGMLHLPEVVHRQFLLSTNPAQDQHLRNEFYYEQVWICVVTIHPSAQVTFTC